MKALIIYDSYFGNTETIAKALQKELSNNGDAKAVKVQEAEKSMLEGIDLLLVGSPTRAFSPTKDISSFVKRLGSKQLENIRAGAFDTRVSTEEIDSKLLGIMVRVFGYAAKPIAKLLAKKGAEKPVQTKWFYVDDKEGPLKTGSIQLAINWARELINKE
ncbi:MAG: flavodoxin family protein [Spirochaetia bacterium]